MHVAFGVVPDWCILLEGARVHTSTHGGEAGQNVREAIGGGTGWTWRRRLLLCRQQKEPCAVHIRYCMPGTHRALV